MTDYYLRKWFDPILRKPCVPIEDFSNLSDLVDSMKTIMSENYGVGLAAPQVGDSRQILVAKVKGKKNIFINPKIIYGEGLIILREGCLSFPRIFVPTFRKELIQVEYQDINGVKIKEIFGNIDAVILQHEIDHLRGKLMFQYFKR